MKKSALSRFVKKLMQRENRTPLSPEEKCHSCDQTLVALPAGTHTLSRCPGCQGTWLSAASLGAALCEKREDQDLLEMVSSDGQAEIAHTYAPSRLPRQCPACATPMENHKFEDSGIWIDTCPDGHGIWLDRGELKLLDGRQKTPMELPDADLEDTFEEAVNSILFSIL